MNLQEARIDLASELVFDIVSRAAHTCELQVHKTCNEKIRADKVLYFLPDSMACDVYIYTNTPDPDKLRTCKYALYSEPSLHFSTVNRLIALLQSSVSYPLEQSRWSHFASVTLPFISRRTVAAISRASQHVDALELRIDCLKNSSTNALHQQLAYLRNQTSLPIIATLRSCREFGDFTGSNKEKFRIYRELLRSGVDYIDIEARSCSNMLPAFIQNAKNNYCSKIIGSVHTSKICDSAAILQMFSEASLNKTADIAKVVTGAATAADCLSMLTASRYVQEPHIGLCIGNAGVITRVHNEVLTPVRAEGMIAAAPGQLSVKKLMQLRIQHGLLRPKRYYLLGSAIQQSRSPAMHNAAFNETLLPHNYSLHDVDAIDQVRSMLHSDFGGASVTIPFKQSVVSLLRNITSDAREIGAVNTIIIDAEHNLVGHNTDWIGIYTPLQKLLGANRHVGSHALVIGAGGTAMAACYALQQLKLKLVIAARNETEGRVLANRLLLDLRLEDNMFRFGANYVNMNETENLNKNNIAVIVSTVPATANVSISSHLLASKPIVFDVVYYPARTVLLQQAQASGCKIIQGASMLLYQAVKQFELWHKRRAPINNMKDALFASLEKIDDDV